MTDESDKRVDEGWKEQVEKERQTPPAAKGPKMEPPRPSEPTLKARRRPATPGTQEAPGTDFGLFLSSLSMQAMVALGEMAHPASGAAQEDLEQARYLIDVLGLLQEKTQGNLTAEEASLLEGVLYELRMKYVSKTRGAQQV